MKKRELAEKLAEEANLTEDDYSMYSTKLDLTKQGIWKLLQEVKRKPGSRPPKLQDAKLKSEKQY